MSSQRSAGRSRSTLSTYAPLIITVSIATVGALAWLYTRAPEDDDADTNDRSDSGPSTLSARAAGWARSPSPAGAWLDSARSAVAAAGSSLGLREDKGKRPARSGEGFSDHERWSEEKRVRAKVAVVILDGERGSELAGRLAYLANSRTTEVFVLVLAPEGGEVDVQRLPSNAHVLPFATPTGYVHMLRHLAPGTVYVQDTPALSGKEGETIGSLRGWVGQTIVVASEQEGMTPWWRGNDMVGPGKGLEVVDTARVEDDWARRVGTA